MTRSMFASFLIHENPNIWYVAVGAQLTITQSVHDIVEVEQVMDEHRVSGLLCDLRAASFDFMQGEFAEVAKRIHLYSPPTRRSVLLTGPRNLKPAVLVTSKLKELGHVSACMTTWAEACDWLGCPQAEDPVPRTRVYI